MHQASIRNLCRSHYTSDQIEAWAGPKRPEQYEPLIRDLVVLVVEEGDIVATWYVMRGTHLGAFPGVPATAKKIMLRAVNVQRIRDGRVVEHWGGSNSLEALLELGLVRWAHDPGAAALAHGAALNGGPVTPVGNSGIVEEPPVVS
jgi:hypothetical protein